MKNINRAYIKEAINFRHACKEFNGNEIPSEDLDLIIESGLLAPSSYGLEPTRMIVVKNPKIKKELEVICMNQKQVSSASAVVVYKGLISVFNPSSNYLKKMITRKTGKDEAAYKAYLGAIDSKLKRLDNRDIVAWSLKQNYLVAQAMMDTAAALGVDSCPIEGFTKSELEAYFKIDSFKEQISLIVAFGYRAKEQGKRIRLPKDEIVEFI